MKSLLSIIVLSTITSVLPMYIMFAHGSRLRTTVNVTPDPLSETAFFGYLQNSVKSQPSSLTPFTNAQASTADHLIPKNPLVPVVSAAQSDKTPIIATQVLPRPAIANSARNQETNNAMLLSIFDNTYETHQIYLLKDFEHTIFSESSSQLKFRQDNKSGTNN